MKIFTFKIITFVRTFNNIIYYLTLAFIQLVYNLSIDFVITYQHDVSYKFVVVRDWQYSAKQIIRIIYNNTNAVLWEVILTQITLCCCCTYVLITWTKFKHSATNHSHILTTHQKGRVSVRSHATGGIGTSPPPQSGTLKLSNFKFSSYWKPRKQVLPRASNFVYKVNWF